MDKSELKKELIITKSNDKYKQCNLCKNKEDIFDIKANEKGLTLVISLCDKCVKLIYLQTIEETEEKIIPDCNNCHYKNNII